MRSYLLLLLCVSLVLIAGGSPVETVEKTPQQPLSGITFTNTNDRLFRAKMEVAKLRVLKEMQEKPQYLANDLKAQQYLKNTWGFHADINSLALLLNGAQDERLVMTPAGLAREHTAGVTLIWKKFYQYLTLASKL